ncbi:MAG: transglycosylase SLT domain-containing protein [Acidobacteria bacterium]|nr:transglycosylase SLT domain-containing protein [Acidobacteriota bacterium]
MRTVRSILLAFAAIAFACRSPQPAPAPPHPSAPPRAESLPSTVGEALLLRADAERYDGALQHLARSSDATTARHARALSALHRVESADVRGAIPLLESAAAESPLLAPKLLVELARARDAAGDSRGALEAARRVIDSHPESGASVEARLIAPTLALRNGDPFAATRLLDAALGVPLDTFTESHLVALASDLDALHKPGLALRVRRHLVESYPRGRHFEQTFARVLHPEGLPSPFDAMTVSQLASLAERFAQAGHADEGLELIRILRGRNPKGPAAERIRITTARLLFRLRRYDDVLMLRIDPKSPYVSELRMLRARAYWRLDRDKEFLQLVKATIRKPPSAQADAEARELLARYHATTTGDHEEAAAIFGALVGRGVPGADGEHLWEEAWQLLLAGADERALASLDRYLRAWPDAAYTANALFWKGKLLEERGDVAGRDEVFARLVRERPYDYFTWRARAIASLPAPPGASIDDAPPFPDIATSPRLGDERAARAAELAAIGLHGDAAREWASLAQAYTSDLAVAYRHADALARSGDANRAIQILLAGFRDVARHGASGVPPRFWQLLYPRAKWEAITTSSARREIDPWLVAAIVRQESAFEPGVVSGAGAVGMMQIMPAEATRIASSEGAPRAIAREELFDPAINIDIGTIELRGLLRRFEGNEVLAVASYNAGEAAVRRWNERRPMGADIDRFIETIPYAETRLYVKIVLRNRHEYRRIYGEGESGKLQQVMRGHPTRADEVRTMNDE